MKRISWLVVLFILFCNINVYAQSIITFRNSDQICDAVKTNKTLKVGLYSTADKKSYVMTAPEGKCLNSEVFTANKDKIKKGEAFVRFGRTTSTNKIYVDNTLVKDQKKYGDYSYFFISNRERTSSTFDATHVLKPGERIFLSLNINNKGVKSNTYKDVRLSFRYGVSSDISLTVNNSLAIYVYTDGVEKNKFGPFKIAEAYYDNVYKEVSSSGSSTKITVYKIVSENLVKGIPAGQKIKSIRIYPYQGFQVNKGSFKLFNLSVDGSTGYKTQKKYTTVSNAENTIRHNIVNNMMENATVKWNIIGTTKIYFYHHYVSSPIKMNPSASANYYGIPYVNQVDTTIEQFTHQGTVNNKTTAKKNNTAYFSHKYTTTYLADATATNGKKIKKGDPLKNNMLYIQESNSKNNAIDPRKSDLANKAFVSNAPGYYLGLDCSSATFLPNARELPYLDSMAGSKRYYSSNQVEILGGTIEVSATKVESYLRKNYTKYKKVTMTEDLYKKYYGEYIKKTYSIQTIYNAYSLLIPGDIVDTYGHVRMASGYPHVVCVNGKVTDRYTSGFCGDKGIDGEKSYAITTEVGSYHNYAYNRSKPHISSSKTGWKYTLNPNLTDLNSVDDLYNPNKKLKSIFNINNKYTFKELYDKNKNKDGIYLPFRYKSMSTVKSNKVEIPTAKFVLDKEYSNKNQVVYNYMATAKKLKGRIFTNYIIDSIRISVNGTKYYIYPGQTNNFSLYEDVKDTKILNAIKKLDYKGKNAVIVSVKFGPNIASVKSAAKADSAGYIKVLDTSGLTAKLSTKVTLSKTSAKVKVGNTIQLTATVTPTNATDKSVTWTSSDTKVATVSSDGVVKGIKKGEVDITVKTNDTGKTAKATITVIKPVSGVKLNKKSTSINVGKTEKIVATVSPSDASDKGVTWTSSNTSIATVSSSGTVTGKSNGTATITVKTKDGAKTATVSVKVVTPTVSVTGVSVSKTSTTLTIGKTEQITATVKPSTATNKSVVWSTSNDSIASVDQTGLITAKGEGTAKVTVKTNDGAKTATVTVKVNPIAVSGVTLNKKSFSLEKGETQKLTATVTPSNATYKSVIWSSSNTNVATVSSSGVVTAKGVGTATITVTTNSGSKKATATVTVIKEEPVEVPPVVEEEDDVMQEEELKPTQPVTPSKPSEGKTPEKKEEQESKPSTQEPEKTTPDEDISPVNDSEEEQSPLDADEDKETPAEESDNNTNRSTNEQQTNNQEEDKNKSTVLIILYCGIGAGVLLILKGISSYIH